MTIFCTTWLMTALLASGASCVCSQQILASSCCCERVEHPKEKLQVSEESLLEGETAPQLQRASTEEHLAACSCCKKKPKDQSAG